MNREEFKNELWKLIEPAMQTSKQDSDSVAFVAIANCARLVKSTSEADFVKPCDGNHKDTCYWPPIPLVPIGKRQRYVIYIAALLAISMPANAEEMKPAIYGDGNLPPTKEVKALVFYRKQKEAKKKYVIYQYELWDGSRFQTTTKIVGVKNLVPFEVSHPHLNTTLKVFGYVGPSVGNGLGTYAGSR